MLTVVTVSNPFILYPPLTLSSDADVKRSHFEILQVNGENHQIKNLLSVTL